MVNINYYEIYLPMDTVVYKETVRVCVKLHCSVRGTYTVYIYNLLRNFAVS